MTMMLDTPRSPEAVAEVFWLAFKALNKPEQDAVLHRLLSVSAASARVSLQPASTLLALRGLVAWGGDALKDSEALYDIENDYDSTVGS
jgi:hypothetical protein